MRFIYVTVLALSVYSSGAFAQESEQAMLAPESSMNCEQAITVFHDVSSFGRKDRAAAKLTERHAEMALSGWRYAGMVIYTENGDLEGFYVSYTRAAACADEQVAQN
jgi:hypothetical protein